MDSVNTFVNLMYQDKFAVVKFKGKMKRIFTKDEEQMHNVQYLHYIFKRKEQDIIPESIVYEKDDDIDDEYDEFSERG